MCGLFGACGPGLSDKDRKAVTILGNLTEVRGSHSTGLFTVSKPTTGNSRRFIYRTTKAVVPATKFMGSKPVSDLLDLNPFVVGGHCRYATHGSVKVANAHPFSVGHFIGTHNGVISSLYDRDNDKTDSQVLFENMQRDGVVKGIQSSLTGGDMALVFLNKSDGTLNYYRNSGRPLWIGIEKSKKKFYWASQDDFLEFLEKNHMVEFSKVYFVEPHILHRVHLESFKLSTEEIKPYRLSWYRAMRESPPAANSGASRPLLEQGPRVPTAMPASLVYARKMTPVSNLSNWDPALNRLSDMKSIEVRSAVNTAAPKTTEASGGPCVFFRGYSKLISISDAQKLVMGSGVSCDCCGGRQKGLFTKVYWYTEKNFICKHCHDDPEVIPTCYEGVAFVAGEFVDKEGISMAEKAAKRRKEQEAIPF